MKNSIFYLSIVLLVIIFTIEVLQKKNRVYLNKLLFIYKDILYLFLLIILSMTISNLMGINAPKQWHIEIAFILRYGLIFFILLFCYLKNYINKPQLLKMILFSLAIQGIDGLYQHIFDIDFISGKAVVNGTWLTGAVFYYNPFGLLMNIGASLCISILLFYRKHIAVPFIIILSILLIIFLYTLLFSLSRASWISFGVFLISSLLITYKQLTLKQFVLLGCIFLGISLLAINNENIFNRISQLLQGDSSHRYEIWISSLKAFMQKPFFGYGLDSFKLVVTDKSEYNGTHSSLLEILLYLGFFGLIIFSALLFLVLKEIYKNKSHIFFPFFASFFIVSQFDHSITSSKIFLSTLTLFLFFIFAQRIDMHQTQNNF